MKANSCASFLEKTEHQYCLNDNYCNNIIYIMLKLGQLTETRVKLVSIDWWASGCYNEIYTVFKKPIGQRKKASRRWATYHSLLHWFMTSNGLLGSEFSQFYLLVINNVMTWLRHCWTAYKKWTIPLRHSNIKCHKSQIYF